MMIKIISICLVAAWYFTHDTAYLLLAMIALLEAIFDVMQETSKNVIVREDVRKAFDGFLKKMAKK